MENQVGTPQTEHSQKRLVLSVVAVVIILLIIGMVYVISKNRTHQNSTGTAVENWKTYKNDEYGFQLSYPSEWVASDTEKNPPWFDFAIAFNTDNNAKQAVIDNEIIDPPCSVKVELRPRMVDYGQAGLNNPKILPFGDFVRELNKNNASNTISNVSIAGTGGLKVSSNFAYTYYLPYKEDVMSLEVGDYEVDIPAGMNESEVRQHYAKCQRVFEKIVSTLKFYTPSVSIISPVSSNATVFSSQYNTDYYRYGFSNHYPDPQTDKEYSKDITPTLGGSMDYFVRQNISTGKIEQLYSYGELVKKVPEMSEQGQGYLYPAIFIQPLHSTKVFLYFLVEGTEGIAPLIYSYDVSTGSFAKLPNVSGIISDSVAGDMGHFCDQGCAYNSDKTKFVMAKYPSGQTDQHLYLIDLMKDSVIPIVALRSTESFDKNAAPYAFEIDVKWLNDHTIQYGVYQPVSHDGYYQSDIYKTSTTTNPVAPFLQYRETII